MKLKIRTRCLSALGKPGVLSMLASAILAFGLFLVSSLNAESEPREPKILRVMTYNIHHGEGIDGRIDLARVASVIAEQKPGIVALQEVDKGVQRTDRRDFPAELAALTGMSCVFSNNFHYQGGEYGNAVLTRLPVRQWTNTHLKMLRAGEQRGVMQLVIDTGAGDVVFMNTHIDFRPDDAERLQNVGEFIEITRRYNDLPIIFCGDFNDMPGSRVHSKMKERFIDTWEAVGKEDGFTITSKQPHKRIDYIWIAKSPALKPVKAWAPHSLASDHLPVVAEFQLD